MSGEKARSAFFHTAVLVILMAPSWLIARPARAYHLGDHKRIMLQAIHELNACFPGTISGADELALWTSDLEEDIDIVRKDFLYSHYFNPYKHLNMQRYDSSVRVSRLESALLADAAGGDTNGIMVSIHLGHAIHHLQDATVPAHVVPVAHWMDDGFETYPFSGDIASGLSCASVAAGGATDLNALLISTAEQTLENVAAIRLPVTGNGQAAIVSGDALWKESDNGDFGRYGLLGNCFGKGSFEEDGVSYAVPDAVAFYGPFKQQQMKLAVRSSLRALYWFLIARGTQ